jgi:hypothetical protein
MMPMGGSVPPGFVLAAFYRIVAVLGVVVVPCLAAVWWRFGRGASPVPSPYRRQREFLTAGLGLLWTVDGLLQLQPAMATRFIGGVLRPLMAGEPGFVQAMVGLGVRLWATSPLLWDAAAAWLQLGIGVLLLFSGAESRARRGALWLSVGWALVVFVFGEALGTVFGGGSLLTGSPGSALLYAVAAMLLLRAPERTEAGAGLRFLGWGWAGLFLLWAGLEAWPAAGWWAPHALSGYVAGMAAMPQPAWIAAPLRAWAVSLARAPAAWNAGITAVTAGLAGAWALGPDRRPVHVATALVLLAAWYGGQDWGVLGGMGTDPNTGAIALLLLGWTIGVYRTGTVNAVGEPEGEARTHEAR